MINSPVSERARERQELALVHDDDDHLVGMVTITDALEYIAGEVEDPYDDPEDAAEEAA